MLWTTGRHTTSGSIHSSCGDPSGFPRSEMIRSRGFRREGVAFRTGTFFQTTVPGPSCEKLSGYFFTRIVPIFSHVPVSVSLHFTVVRLFYTPARVPMGRERGETGATPTFCGLARLGLPLVFHNGVPGPLSPGRVAPVSSILAGRLGVSAFPEADLR